MNDRKLIDYLPTYLNNFREYKAILTDAEDSEISTLWNKIENAFKDQFVINSTEYGVSRWEKILGIIPKGTATLEERKFTILSRLNEQLPFTYNALVNQLIVLCGNDGYSIQLNSNDYKLTVYVELAAKNNFIDVERLLERVVPANMIKEVKLKYNQYSTLEQFKHSELEKFTYDELRNEVLSNGN